MAIDEVGQDLDQFRFAIKRTDVDMLIWLRYLLLPLNNSPARHSGTSHSRSISGIRGHSRRTRVVTLSFHGLGCIVVYEAFCPSFFKKT